MQTTLNRFGSTAIAFLLAAMSLGIAGCEKKGPLEEAGEALDDRIEDARDEIEDAAEEAAEEVDEAAEDVEDALRDR